MAAAHAHQGRVGPPAEEQGAVGDDHGAPPGALRLAHGYTNATSTDGRTVTKRYLGPDAARRQGSEVAALSALAGRLPVPGLVEQGQGWIRTALAPGVAGQELLAGAPGEVLAAVGATARRLHQITGADLPGWTRAGSGAVLVHGDFGPQNMLLDAESIEVSAVVDWELAHLGDPLEDLAWAEWIVRTHHSDLAEHLPALFAGYGDHPPWARRHAAMVAGCHHQLDFVRRWEDNGAGAALWLRRIEATASLRE